jgi:hypothetical protein
VFDGYIFSDKTTITIIVLYHSCNVDADEFLHFEMRKGSNALCSIMQKITDFLRTSTILIK